jgi:hypothetical protein
MVMNAQSNDQDSTSDQKEPIRFGLVLPQMAQLASGDLEKVLDSLRVQGRGAPRKRLQAKMNKPRSKGKCGYCGNLGHNIRTCKKLIEVVNVVQVSFLQVCIGH